MKDENAKKGTTPRLETTRCCPRCGETWLGDDALDARWLFNNTFLWHWCGGKWQEVPPSTTRQNPPKSPQNPSANDDTCGGCGNDG